MPLRSERETRSPDADSRLTSGALSPIFTDNAQQLQRINSSINRSSRARKSGFNGLDLSSSLNESFYRWTHLLEYHVEQENRCGVESCSQQEWKIVKTRSQD